MKTWIKKWIGLVVLGLLSFHGVAQERQLTPEEKEQAKERLLKYMDALNLSEAQEEPYKTIVAKYADQMRFVQAAELTKQEKLKEIRAIQERKDTEIKALLSDSQYEVYLAFKAEQRDMAMSKVSEEFAEYKERLNLSEDQLPVFMDISSRSREDLKALKNSSKSRFAKYKAYKKIQKNKHKEMKALLSSEQYEVYLEIEEEVQKKLKERRSNR